MLNNTDQMLKSAFVCNTLSISDVPDSENIALTFKESTESLLSDVLYKHGIA